MQVNSKEKFKIAIRWVAILPGSILAGWIAWVLVSWVNRITIMPYVDPNSFMARLHIEFVASVAMSAAFVYCGAKIAPSHNKEVTYVLAMVALVAIGFALFPAVMLKDYWAFWAGLSGIFGVAWVVYSIHHNEAKVSQSHDSF